jgi:anti-anti-sigma factor
MLNLKIHKLGDATVIQCAGRITFPGADNLRAAILRQSQMQALVLDLADINAVDAAGLGVLVFVRAWARKTGTALKLMNIHPNVEKLLELTNLNWAFGICSAREMLDLLCRAIHETESELFEPAFQESNSTDQPRTTGYW